jgi:hypothetical protein
VMLRGRHTPPPKSAQAAKSQGAIVKPFVPLVVLVHGPTVSKQTTLRYHIEKQRRRSKNWNSTSTGACVSRAKT